MFNQQPAAKITNDIAEKFEGPLKQLSLCVDRFTEANSYAGVSKSQLSAAVVEFAIGFLVARHLANDSALSPLTERIRHALSEATSTLESEPFDRKFFDAMDVFATTKSP